MEQPFEMIHTGENEPRFNMPYAPAVKVHSGKMVFLAGVNAAPVYHSHPHIAAEFDDIPLDPGDQAAMAIEAIRQLLVAAGGGLEHVVEVPRTDTLEFATGITLLLSYAGG